MYALTPEAESAKAKKWDARSRVGLYLKPSLMHAELVSLVLSLETGLASPRFSVLHDDFFERTSYNQQITQTKSMCQILSGLDYVVSIQRQQNVKDFSGNTEDVYDILNDESKSPSKPSEGVQL